MQMCTWVMHLNEQECASVDFSVIHPVQKVQIAALQIQALCPGLTVLGLPWGSSDL